MFFKVRARFTKRIPLRMYGRVGFLVFGWTEETTGITPSPEKLEVQLRERYGEYRRPPETVVMSIDYKIDLSKPTGVGNAA